jgi:hypothetical protein
VTVGTDAGGANAVTAEQTRISAGYFVALGVPLRAGRVFAREDSAPVHTAIVNETLARRLLVAFHSLRLVGIGSALGIAVTLGLARVVRASGGGGTIFDPENAAFVFPLAIVLAIAAVATWIPSRRALKIDPAVLLRSP